MNNFMCGHCGWGCYGSGPSSDFRIILGIPTQLYSEIEKATEASEQDLDAIFHDMVRQGSYAQKIKSLIELNDRYKGYIAEAYECQREAYAYLVIEFDEPIGRRALQEYDKIFKLGARFPYHHGWHGGGCGYGSGRGCRQGFCGRHRGCW